jgi:hypothetical protein
MVAAEADAVVGPEVDRDEDGAAAGVVDLGAADGEFGVGAGATGLGADTPAISEPSPSFCRLSALSFPLGSRPWPDWNFCIAATVFKSHLPLGSPW